MDAADRSEDDRAVDPDRRPAELLTFLGVKPGMRVGLLVAGAGYTAELLARACGPTGVVFAENPAFVFQGLDDAPWRRRLALPVMKTVVRIDRELEGPFPDEVRALDLVVINSVYHDLVRLGVDREKMNREVFAFLKPGGRYAVIDHSALPGSGTTDVSLLHRIDESSVIREIRGAGFSLETTGAFLRDPADARDWNASPGVASARRTSDRFALMFVKP